MYRIILFCSLEGITDSVVTGTVEELNSLCHVLIIGDQRFGVFKEWYKALRKISNTHEIKIEVD